MNESDARVLAAALLKSESLCRELYEALKDATAAKFEPLDPEVRDQYLELLARYEREVGK